MKIGCDKKEMTFSSIIEAMSHARTIKKARSTSVQVVENRDGTYSLKYTLVSGLTYFAEQLVNFKPTNTDKNILY